MSKIVLGITGKMASGKGTIADYLKDKHNAASYRFSTPLRDVLRRIYIEESRQNMQDLSLDLRNRFGDDLLASIIAGDVKNDDTELIVVDGVRRLPDIKHLRELPEFKLIAVTADQKTRWERMTKRGENVDDVQKTFEEFKQNEQNEAEQHIEEVSKTADFTIDNNGDYDSLYKQVEDILNQLNGN